MIDTVFDTVLRMSLSAAAVILAVLALRLLLRKLPKGYSYALWLLVLARLLCPVFPEASFSPMPEVDTAIIRVERTITQVPAQKEGKTESQEATIAAGEVPDRVQETSETEKAETTTIQAQVVPWLWLTGAVGMLAWGIVSYLVLKRRLRTAVPLEDRAYLADHIETPFVMGWLRPKIYLPSDLTEAWIEPILLHERYHIRRGDPVVKGLFFLALCLHWFNPLVWLAYFLMGRDMEMRCDEAVMKKLGDAARAEYAQSLLCLATGRRSFLAAPLAFGEGDTKGRIRNVLNYRRPKFWLCILAVVLCAAVAMCVLTDPKEQRPDQLEYPGLEWNMSPEEVKQKLGITEDMIILESESPPKETNDDYEYGIQVRGLECFGAMTKTVALTFIDQSGTGESLGLCRMDIYYPDGMEGDGADTDMEAVRERLTAFYGTDSPEYTYKNDWDGNDYTVKAWPPKWQWIPETRAGEYLTEDEIDSILQYYREAYEQAPPEGVSYAVELSQWEDIIREHPLVTMVCWEMNKILALHPDEYRAAGMTNKWIRFDAGNLTATLQFLENTGAKEKAQEEAETPDQLEYPGLEWNMSPEEVKQELGITEDMIVEEADTPPENVNGDYCYGFRLSHYECFGAEAENVIFRFVDTTGTGSFLGLYSILIFYPDGETGQVTDMVAVRERLTECYGEYDSEVTYFDLSSGAEKTVTSETPNCRWVPEVRGGEYLSDGDIGEILDYYRDVYALIPTTEEMDRALLEDWEKAIRSYPLVNIACVENAISSKNWAVSVTPGAVRENGATEYCISFNANALVRILQFLESSNRQNYDVQLLEYPGIPWLSSPTEVKKALARMDGNLEILSEYTRDTQQEDVSYSYAEYRLRITGMTCFGQETQMVEFCFHDYTWTMEALQLAEIRVYYPDGYEGGAADLDALVDTLTRMYGEQTEELVFRYLDTGNKIREEREPVDSTLTGCWYSPIGGRDLLSQEQKEALYQRRIANQGEQAWIPTLEEYLTTLETGIVNITLRETYYYGGGPEITEEIRAQGGTNYVLTLNAGGYVQCRNIDVQLEALNASEES